MNYQMFVFTRWVPCLL